MVTKSHQSCTLITPAVWEVSKSETFFACWHVTHTYSKDTQTHERTHSDRCTQEDCPPQCRLENRMCRVSIIYLLLLKVGLTPLAALDAAENQPMGKWLSGPTVSSACTPWPFTVSCVNNLLVRSVARTPPALYVSAFIIRPSFFFEPNCK